MLDKELVINKMKERGFIIYANIGKTKIQFISSHMYNTHNEENKPLRKKMPIINIIVDLEYDEFYGIYNIKESINTLNLPVCGSVLNDNHFDSKVCKFELHAKLLENFI